MSVEQKNIQPVSMATTLDLKQPHPFDAKEGLSTSKTMNRNTQFCYTQRVHWFTKYSKHYKTREKNIIYERYVFKQTHPSPGESIDSFFARLRTLAETCEFESAKAKIQINGTPFEVTIDSGTTTNIVDSAAFSCIQNRNRRVQLELTQTKIYAYNAVQPLPLLGKCCLAVESNRKRVLSTFYDVKG